MPNLLIKYSLLTFPLASMGLGFWQIKRLEWKKDLISKLESRLSGEPIDILQLESLDDLEKLEYKRFKATGRFDQDPAHQIFLKPRPLIINKEALLRGRTPQQSNVGVNVVTPFSVDGTNLRILVNRGWLATSGQIDTVNSSAHLGLGSPNKSLELVGILRLSDKLPKYGLKNNETTNEWQIRDVEAMARALKTAPIFIEADEKLSPHSGPIGGQTQLTVRNEHLNYAITWFSLAAFSYIMWYSRYGRRRMLFAKLHR